MKTGSKHGYGWWASMLPFRKMKKSSSWEGDAEAREEFSEYEPAGQLPTLSRSMSDGHLTTRASASTGHHRDSNFEHHWAWRTERHDDGCDQFDGFMPHLEPIESGGLTLEQLKSYMTRDARDQVCDWNIHTQASSIFCTRWSCAQLQWCRHAWNIDASKRRAILDWPPQTMCLLPSAPCGKSHAFFYIYVSTCDDDILHPSIFNNTGIPHCASIKKRRER